MKLLHTIFFCTRLKIVNLNLQSMVIEHMQNILL